MKLHLRVLKMGDACLRLITLRPGADVAFSTNYFHETWHILSDQHGAHLLGRLLWGLSYQSTPGAAVLLHGEHITPAPFGAEPSNPILLGVAGHTHTGLKRLRSLRRRLTRLGPSDCSVRWKTFGLDTAIKRSKDYQQTGREEPEFVELGHTDARSLWGQECMFRRGGFVCYTAPPEILRMRALTIAQLDPSAHGMDYYFLADGRSSYRWPDGEVQVFSDYRERRDAAEQARRTVLAPGQQFDTPEKLYEVIAMKRDDLLAKRRASQRGRLNRKAYQVTKRDTRPRLRRCVKLSPTG